MTVYFSRAIHINHTEHRQVLFHFSEIKPIRNLGVHKEVKAFIRPVLSLKIRLLETLMVGRVSPFVHQGVKA